MTAEAMLADRSQGDLIVVSAINTAASAHSGGGRVSPCCERVSPHLPVLLGPLTILTLTYEREQSAFLCFYIKDSKQNVSNNTNVFPYSLGHQKLKGYC